MTTLLRFIFSHRFNRLDMLAGGVGAISFSDGKWTEGLALLVVFAFASAIGADWLERRS